MAKVEDSFFNRELCNSAKDFHLHRVRRDWLTSAKIEVLRCLLQWSISFIKSSMQIVSPIHRLFIRSRLNLKIFCVCQEVTANVSQNVAVDCHRVQFFVEFPTRLFQRERFVPTDFLEFRWRATNFSLYVPEEQFKNSVDSFGDILHRLRTELRQIFELRDFLQLGQMKYFFEFVLIQILDKQFMVAFMKCNSMIESQPAAFICA